MGCLKFLCAGLLALPGLASAQEPIGESINDLVERDTRFTILRKLMKTTGTNMTLSGGRQDRTLFAPTDAAFRKLPPNVLKAILGNDRLAAPIVMAHILPGKYGIMTFNNGTAPLGQPLRHHVLTANGDHIHTVATKTGEIFANGAKIIGERYAKNGTILIIDAIMPVTIDPPRREGLSRSVPEELFRWGLARYNKPSNP